MEIFLIEDGGDVAAFAAENMKRAALVFEASGIRIIAHGDDTCIVVSPDVSAFSFAENEARILANARAEVLRRMEIVSAGESSPERSEQIKKLSERAQAINVLLREVGQ